jgi:hypothetical protein
MWTQQQQHDIEEDEVEGGGGKDDGKLLADTGKAYESPNK